MTTNQYDPAVHITKSNDLVDELQKLAAEIAGAAGRKDASARDAMVAAAESVRRNFAHAIVRACVATGEKATRAKLPPVGPYVSPLDGWGDPDDPSPRPR